jgi:hypothetical protein
MIAHPRESVSSPFSPSRFRLSKMRGSCKLVSIDNANRTDFSAAINDLLHSRRLPFQPDGIDRRIF